MVLGPAQRKELWVSAPQGTLDSPWCWRCSWWKTNYCHCHTASSWLCCSLGFLPTYDAVLPAADAAATNGLRTATRLRYAAANGLPATYGLPTADATANGLPAANAATYGLPTADAIANGLPAANATTDGLPTANATTNATAHGLSTVPRVIADVRTTTLIQMKIV